MTKAKSSKRPAAKKLAAHVDTVTVDALGSAAPKVPAIVYVPPSAKLNGARVVKNANITEPVSVKDNIIRISNEVDPIGMLIALAKGEPVPTHHVRDDGKGTLSVETVYETLPLKDRLKLIGKLADKVMPRMSVTQTRTPGDTNKNAGWDAALLNAANQYDATDGEFEESDEERDAATKDISSDGEYEQ